MKKHNFNAGPSILPREVIENTAQAILDFNGSGLSLMEISHRAKDFQPVVDEAVALFKELLNIPEGYSVLFLGGGASLEFCMVPFNFLEKKAAYLNTGVWAKKAMKEAKAFGEVVEVASSAESTYTYIPKDYTVPADADYFHITTNNTIYGTELKEDLDVNVPMVLRRRVAARALEAAAVEIVWLDVQRVEDPEENLLLRRADARLIVADGGLRHPQLLCQLRSGQAKLLPPALELFAKTHAASSLRQAPTDST